MDDLLRRPGLLLESASARHARGRFCSVRSSSGRIILRGEATFVGRRDKTNRLDTDSLHGGKEFSFITLRRGSPLLLHPQLPHAQPLRVRVD